VLPDRFMFDFDVGKLLIFGIVALAVIPPKDLPRVMRTVGQALGKMRRMASEFQGQFMEAMKEADLESVKKEFTALEDSTKKEIAALENSAKVDSSFDPAMAMRQEITHAVDGPKQIGVSQVALNGAAEPPAESAPQIDQSPALAPPAKEAERPDAEHAAARGAAE
jgi:sec-independent protein translocase protein TatB